MKLKSTLLATALIVFATSTATVFAADDATAGKTEAAKTHCSQLTSPAEGVESLLFRTLSCFLPLKSSLGVCG